MSKYFEHIEDCTIYAWQKAISGNLEHLRLDENGTPEEDIKAWDSTYNSYIEEFGLGKDHLRLIELKMELSGHQLNYIIDNDRKLLNRINAVEAEIKGLLVDKNKEGQDMTTTLIMVTKWIGSKVDQKNTTILELYKMLDLIKKEGE